MVSDRRGFSAPMVVDENVLRKKDTPKKNVYEKANMWEIKVHFVTPSPAAENIILRDVGVGGGVGLKVALGGGEGFLEKFKGGLSKTFRIKIRRRIEVEKMMDNEDDVWFKY
ncbi:hypothetical protein Tco_0052263 [Tanacetum coccineum]